MKTVMNEPKSRTYGVFGIMEWQALIPAGRCTVRVNFTGGMLSAYGVKPATYTTNNAAMQRLIENSKYYQHGKIVRVK